MSNLQNILAFIGAIAFAYFALEYDNVLCGVASFFCLLAALGE